MSGDYTERVREMQRRLFGNRYVGASLAKITQIPSGSLGRIQKWIERKDGALVIFGPPGTGKTYFCSALLEELMKNVFTIRAYKETDFLRRVRNSMSQFQNDDYLTTVKYMIDDDLIILDDLGSSGHTQWREEVLFHVIDERYHSMKPTIFTSNLDRNDFSRDYGERIASRLFAKENTVIDLKGVEDLRSQGL